MKRQLNLNDIREHIIFECISGSHAYGTALPTSDVDTRGIFIQPKDMFLAGLNPEQVSDDKNDITFYEVKRFLDLIIQSNPTILELLNMPEDCIKYKDPIMSYILVEKQKFLTKTCRHSFGGYAIQQIKKARGLDKKINWEESEMKRKTVLDFCYILFNGGSKPIKDFFVDGKLNQSDLGLAAVDHAHNIYAVYNVGYMIPNGAGIVSNEETANDIQLTSIPKGVEIFGYMSFNKDGYTSHCKKYKEYQDWLKNRNEDRVKLDKEHGKRYDGKNMMHCYRLLNTAYDIATKGELIVRRPKEELTKLLAIRKGEYEYENLLSEAEEMILKMDDAFLNSSLPEKVDDNIIIDLTKTLREIHYKIF